MKLGNSEYSFYEQGKAKIYPQLLRFGANRAWETILDATYVSVFFGNCRFVNDVLHIWKRRKDSKG